MKYEFNQYEQIDQYLDNQLSGEELSAFEAKMKAEPSFLEAVNSQRFINELIIDQGLLSLKKKMQKLDSRGTSKGTKFGVYGCAVLLISVITVGLYMNKINTKAQQPTPLVPKKETQVIMPMTAKVGSNKTNPSVKSSKQREQDLENHTPTAITSSDSVSIVETNHTDRPIVTPLENNEATAIHKNIPTKESEHQEKQITACNLENSSLRITTEESCSDSPIGKIIVENNSHIAGQGPFRYSINHKNFYTSPVFANLYSGSYNISIKDAHGCVWMDVNEIIIKEKDCKIHEYSFYPRKQEVWKFPLENSINGTIEIYSRSGSLVYKSQIVNGYPDSWNGTSNDNQQLPMGNYSFLLKCGDKLTMGNVTLFK